MLVSILLSVSITCDAEAMPGQSCHAPESASMQYCLTPLLNITICPVDVTATATYPISGRWKSDADCPAFAGGLLHRAFVGPNVSHFTAQMRAHNPPGQGDTSRTSQHLGSADVAKLQVPACHR